MLGNIFQKAITFTVTNNIEHNYLNPSVNCMKRVKCHNTVDFVLLNTDYCV